MDFRFGSNKEDYHLITALKILTNRSLNVGKFPQHIQLSSKVYSITKFSFGQVKFRHAFLDKRRFKHMMQFQKKSCKSS